MSVDDLDTPNCRACLHRMEPMVGGVVGWQCPECGQVQAIPDPALSRTARNERTPVGSDAGQERVLRPTWRPSS